MKANMTQIPVKKDTRDKLRALCRRGQTYDDILNHLLPPMNFEELPGGFMALKDWVVDAEYLKTQQLTTGTNLNLENIAKVILNMQEKQLKFQKQVKNELSKLRKQKKK